MNTIIAWTLVIWLGICLVALPFLTYRLFRDIILDLKQFYKERKEDEL